MRIKQDTQIIIESMSLYDKQNGCYTPFRLWPKQVDWLDLIHAEKRVAMLKKRQVAGSTLTGDDSCCQCGLLENFETMLLSKTGEDAEELLRRIKECYVSLPEEWQALMPLEKPAFTQPRDELVFKNGSRLLSLPANKGAGHTSDRVVIDEAGKITRRNSRIDLETVLMNVEPAVEKADGQLILVGTAEGYNLFQRYYSKGKSGLTRWKSFFFSCWDDPTFTPEKRDQIVADHGEDHASQEYPRNDAEAFLMSGRCRFNRKCLQEMMNRDIRTGEKGYLEKVGQRIFWRPDPDGWFTVYEHPENKYAYTAGFDYAEGVELEGTIDEKDKTDFSAGSVIRKEDDRLIQVARIHCKLPVDLFKDETRLLAEYYNQAFYAGERNKDGLVTLKWLRKEGYSNLFYQIGFDPDAQVKKRKLGWLTNKVTKPELVAFTDDLIRHNKLVIRSEDTLGEFITFVRNADGSTSAQEGCHDDECMALMIALYCYQYAPLAPSAKQRKVDYETGQEVEKIAKLSRGY